jgi:hypothetical protein
VFSLVSSDVTGNSLTEGDGGNAVDQGGITTGAHGGVSFTFAAAGTTGTSGVQITNSHIDGNSATGGAGFAGLTTGGAGGAGGNGGSALGGGVFFNNSSGSTLLFNMSGGSASNNQLTAGIGGDGGDAGSSGVNNIPGGRGGDGGAALGGGVFLFANSASTSAKTTGITGLGLDGNTLNAGAGGTGGAGAVADGGQGGLAAGGGVYNDSRNNGSLGYLGLTNDTMAGNLVNGGAGGIADTGTTANGGNGGRGGDGGNAEGGGFFSGDNTQVAVTNTTVGGLSNNPQNPDDQRNILTAGNGGRGGNAGTAANTLVGATGGNGGSVEGAGVFIDSGTATFINDTITANEAILSLTNGAGGAPGDGAGTGLNAVQGNPGLAGTANGGGYFAAGKTGTVTNPTVNNLGNSIIDLNTAGTTMSGTMVSTSPDLFGTFASDLGAGHNIIGSTAGATYVAGTGDQIGVSAAQLNMGPVLNNGGNSPTTALLTGSVAINAGNNALVPVGIATDARGAGFARIAGGTVDVGAFELETPTINSINPTSANEWGPAFTLTITGTNFESGAVVAFGTDTLTPTSASSALIQVTVPASDLLKAGPVSVSVENPDGSGTPGQFIASAPMTFTVTQPPTLPLNPPVNQSNNEGDAITSFQVTSTDPNATGFAATNLPKGLNIDPASGVISGTIDPYAAGTYTVTISAHDSNVTTLTGSTSFTWVVADVTPPSLTNPGNLTNTAGDTVSLTLVSQDAGAGTWTATGLPTGLTIDPNTGVISGTIDQAASGNFSVTVSASDPDVGSSGATSSVSFNWKVNDLSPPQLGNPGSQANNEGDGVSLKVPVNNFIPGTITATGLPTGLSIDANTGVISGVIDPRGAGSYLVKVSAKNGSLSASISFNWAVADTTPPQLTSPGNQSNTAGDAVNLAPISTVDVDPGSFTATGLPTGLTINPTTGAITGTIASTASGTFNVTVSAADGSLPTSVGFSWAVKAAPGGTGGGTGSSGGTTGGTGGTTGGTGGSSNGSTTSSNGSTTPVQFGTTPSGFVFSGLLAPLPPLGQSAGLFGLALEEFELTVDTFLANANINFGYPGQHYRAVAGQLEAAILNDPLHASIFGTFALLIGNDAAVQMLGSL